MYAKNTLDWRKKNEMVNARWCSSSRIRRIQKVHIAFVPASVAKREKYEIRAVDKKMQTERNKAKQRQQYRGQSTQGSNSLFRN